MMSSFSLADDHVSNAVRFWCKYIASGSRRADDEMYNEAALSLLKTQVAFDPKLAIDKSIDLVNNHGGNSGSAGSSDIRQVFEKEMLRWIASKIALLISSDERVDILLHSIAEACSNSEGFRRSVRGSFADEASQDTNVTIKEEPIDDDGEELGTTAIDLASSPTTTSPIADAEVETRASSHSDHEG